MKRIDRTDEMLGQLIGPLDSPSNGPRYCLTSLLGRQTGRRTFLAIDTRDQSQVVVKLLLFGPDFTWDDLKLFEREAQTLKSLDHQAIPRYLDSFEVETPLGAGFVLVQTYIEAQSLQAWAVSGYRFSEQELKVIARSLLTILQYLHSRHPAVVHRDIKPSNILLSEHVSRAPRHVYLVDFGSVQATQPVGTMTVVGTYGYMPPEQFGGRAQPASDLYSLGATLIYLSSGQHPAELTQANMQIDFEGHTQLSRPFAQWIRQLTYADLSQRTGSVAEALQQLEQSEQSARADSPRFQKPAGEPLAPRDNSRRRLPLALQKTFNDFSVSSNSQELEVKFFRSRITGNITQTEKLPFSTLVLYASPLLLIVLLWVFGVAGFWLALGIIAFSFPSSKPKSNRALSHKGLARLGLWFPTGGPLLLSLDMLRASIDPNGLTGRSDNLDRDPQLSHLAVRSIEVGPGKKQNQRQISFHFVRNDGTRTGRLNLRASSDEVQWLCDHLTQWKDIPIEHSN